MHRAPLLALLLVGAVLSFGLAIWSAMQGRIPVIEMAHAVLFTLLALVVAAAPQQASVAGCRECGTAATPGFSFCLGCGRTEPERRVRRTAL